MKLFYIFGFLSLLLIACGPNTTDIQAQAANSSDIQAQAVVTQQRLTEHQKHYVFTNDEINRCKATPGNSSDKIESHIRNSMKDPDAVKIHNLSKGPLIVGEIKQKTNGQMYGAKSPISFCGWIWSAEVNGKNSYGAYVGYKRYYYIAQVGLKNEKLGFFVPPNNMQSIMDFEPSLLSNDSYTSKYNAWIFRIIE
jgi:hypothetical protein